MTLEELEQLAESGFTAGPWYVGAQNDALFIINTPPNPTPSDFVQNCRDEECHVIARVDEKDAKLIAAAPSLLATAIAAKKREKELVEALCKCKEFTLMLNSSRAENLHDNVITPALLKDIEQ